MMHLPRPARSRTIAFHRVVRRIRKPAQSATAESPEMLRVAKAAAAYASDGDGALPVVLAAADSD